MNRENFFSAMSGLHSLILLFLFNASFLYAYTGSFTLPMMGACDNGVLVCDGNLYIAWTDWGYAGSCTNNDGMILVAENVDSFSCPGASNGHVCRGPGSNCYGNGPGEDYYYNDCPQACTYTTLEPEESSSSSEPSSSSRGEYTGSFTLPMMGACDNGVLICDDNLYIVWTNRGYAGGCTNNDGMILVAENVVSFSCPGASHGYLCRGPGSNCYGNGPGEDYYYNDCPQVCTYTALEPEEPPELSDCPPTESAARTLFATKRAECEPPPPSSSSTEPSSNSEEASSSSEQKDCFDNPYEAQTEYFRRTYQCTSIGKYPNFDIDDKHCIVGGCDNEPSSSSEEASSSSSEENFYPDADGIFACPSNMLKKSYGESYDDLPFYDEPPIEAQRQGKTYYYNVKGQAVGTVGESVKGRTARYLARRDKTKTYNYLGEKNIEDELPEFDYEENFLAKPGTVEGIESKCKERYGYVEYMSDGRPFYVGGITCPYAEADFEIFTTEGKKINLKKKNAKECVGKGEFIYRFDNMILKTFPKSVKPKPYDVGVGYEYFGGHIATEAEINSVKKHEQGHVDDVKCTLKKLQDEPGNGKRATPLPNGCICENDWKKLKDKEMQKDLDAFGIKLKEDGEKYHNKYGRTGYPPQGKYVCPK